MAEVFILSGVRSPIGKFLGGLSSLSAPQLAAPVIQTALARAGVPVEQVSEVILGHVLAAGVGQAPARQAALSAGLPHTVSAWTVNQVCGSGLKAVMLGAQSIQLGNAELVVAGGMESMSRAPHLLPGSRTGHKYGNVELVDVVLNDGLWCSFEQQPMGVIAEQLATEQALSRTAQDAWAAESHQRAIAAQGLGRFAAEIVPLEVTVGKNTVRISADEGPRADCDAAALARLRPAFSPTGTVTAGNASQLSDGAAAVVLASAALAERYPSPVLGKIVASATSGTAPRDLFVAPITAIQRVLERAKLTLNDIQLFELNEAFAAQCLACTGGLQLDPQRVNVHGGAIALGHPIGASGARTLVTLLHALAARNLRRGLVALCLGGGNAVAMIIERT